MKNRKTQRSLGRIIKLYDWLWRRANNGKCPPFCKLNAQTLTGHALVLLIPEMLPISKVLQSPAYRKAVSEIIHSN